MTDLPPIIEVKAHARAKRREVRMDPDGTFDVWTTAAPDRGRANEDIVELLAAHLALPKSALELVSGHTASRKRFRVAK